MADGNPYGVVDDEVAAFRGELSNFRGPPLT
jgi:hypothetical protein